MKRYLLFILSVCFIPPIFTAEVDSITPRNILLDNSVETINRIVGLRLREGVHKANARQGYSGTSERLPTGLVVSFCDEDALYTELRKAIFQSFTVSLGLKGYDLDRQLRELLAGHSYSLRLNDSIYRDIDYLEGFSLRLKELSDVVNLDGQLVGLDKLGHFFAQGWQYFEMTAFDDKTLYDALAWGQDREAGRYGYTTTGIFSYADLAANLEGWRFWTRVRSLQDDPLKGFFANLLQRPYVGCDIQIVDSIRNLKIVRAWEYNVSFDLSDYVDGAWDEANNCNSYADPLIEAKVVARIEQVSPGFVCPLNRRACAEARDRYGVYAKDVLHPQCLTAAKAAR
jgi:hypothetical protein